MSITEWQISFKEQAPLTLSGLAEGWRMVKRENHDFLTAGSANVLMQADDICPCGFVNHRHQNRPCLFNQLGSDLLEEVSAFFGRERLD